MKTESGRLVARQHPQRGDEPDGAEHDVDQEDRPPGQAADVRADDEPGQDRADDGRRAHHRPEHGERGAHLIAVERADQQADALRDQQRAEAALGQPGGDQHHRVDRQAGRERGEGEPGDADQEHPPLAVPVAEPGADHQQHPHRERVAGAEPLDQRLAAADVADDGGRGDVGDRRVHQVEHIGQDHQDEDQAQPGRQPRGPAVTASASVACRGRRVLGHARSPFPAGGSG